MTRPRILPSDTVRSYLLAELGSRLGEYGCSTALVDQLSGGAVLWVDRTSPPQGGLCVRAVRHPDGWIYAWGRERVEARHPDEAAARIARTVTG
ncbi:hypothetical protein [Actinocorallia populi]|uniref:hypothetical protein n=1 Tax=Actinocorallia populi TaxID=2079200 RepID=UPI00130058C5|nr:hypothetical protein [Actinocorallia populi]